MNGNDLKRALKLRHDVYFHRRPACEAERALREICSLMAWKADSIVREVAARAEEEGRPLDCAYRDYFGGELRDRLNRARWEFARNHPGDPAVKEIVELVRSWQRQQRQRDLEEQYEQVEFPPDDEAYEEGSRTLVPGS